MQSLSKTPIKDLSLKIKILRMSLQTRFILSVAIVLLPLLGLAVGAILSIQLATSAIEETMEEVTEELVPIARTQALFSTLLLPIRDYLMEADPSRRDLFDSRAKEVDEAFEATRSAPFRVPKEQELIDSAYEEWQQAKAIGYEILGNTSPVWGPAIGRELQRLGDHIERGANLLEQASGLTILEISEQREQANAVRQRAFFLMPLVFVLGLAIAVMIGVSLARSILRPVHALELGAKRFGSGDLSYRVELDSQDELGQLAETFNIMAQRLEEYQTMLEILSTHDDLTGLYNHREFYRRLKEEIRRAERYGHPLALLMLDFDDFKLINDTYGHRAGDEVLRATALLISREVRPIDHIARYGGEEFAIILPETPLAGAYAMAERIRRVIAAYSIAIAPGQAVNLTVSIGVASFPQDGKSESELIGAADQALYDAKHAGRNAVRGSDSPSVI